MTINLVIMQFEVFPDFNKVTVNLTYDTFDKNNARHWEIVKLEFFIPKLSFFCVYCFWKSKINM